ncbi:Tetratricopeptide repeat-containing protein [Chitinophaga ginsengisegetis]|uniref:Tetratricopeptide repeat-containing protein n=1 Tax=Chitinophaga ginsengisegetis TaxID=393003 RepID=A0A1T5ND99_9BACT|nr:Tetratricopeptide repeat-containing protein [Chitinophaga ginsengisegetis]
MHSCTQVNFIKKILRRQLLITGCLLSYFYAIAQCPPAAIFVNRITAIEENNLPDKEKIKQLDSLLALYQQCFSQKDSIYARIVHRIGNLCHLEGNWPDALRYTKEAIAVNRTAKARQEAFLTNSYFNLGLFYNKLHLYPESHYYYDSCIIIGLKYPGKTAIALMAFEAKTFSLYGTGDYRRAVETADLGILVARSVQDTMSEVALLAQKAQSLLAVDDTSAGTVIRNALRLLPANAPPAHEVACYTIYASILGKEKQFGKAVAWYQHALQANREQQRWDQCARNTLDLGNLYAEDIKNAGTALRYYREGIQFAQKSGDPYVLAGVYNNIGYACWKLRRYRKALSYYQQGLNALPLHFKDTALQSNPGYHMLRNVANDYFVSTLLGNKGESLLALFRSDGDTVWLRYALNAFRAADISVDQMRWKQYGDPSRLFWRNRTRTMYQKAIETCYLLQDIPSAFHFFEKSRAVLLNDKLNELGARKYLSAADIAQEQQLRIQTVTLQQQLEATSPDAPLYVATYRRLLNARDALERFIKNLEKAHPAYYQYKYDTAVYTVADIRKKLLAHGETLVTYFTTDSTTFVLGISAGNSRLLKAAWNSREVKELMQLCTSPSLLNTQHQRYCVLANRLYRQLFAPLQLRGGSVIISPDEYLLPFEVLLSDSTDPNSFLLKQFAFSYTYAAGSLMKLRPERAAAAHSLLGIAPVNYAAYLQQQPLYGADESLLQIKKNYAAVYNLSGKAATRQHFLEQLPNSSIVQLYSHASAGSPDKDPVLYFADSALYLPEIQLLQDTVTALIILSTCESGAGVQARGEGVLSLARGFTLTGIPAIVTSLWQIDNEATYELTENFHRLLQSGLRKDVALQQAKLQFLANNDKGSRLPYFWAASILVGDAAPVPETRSRSGVSIWWIVVAIAVGLALIPVLLKKNR